ncbi:MAG TPA: Uma2 family endonuclease [Tepidisphaeraceae bacterium]|nr:Uma2 family endonuclease [Tepidisphaeraceae bacterium]
MSRTTTVIKPNDHGRPMTLDEFDLAKGVEGHLYELGRGVIVVTDVPSTPHMRQVEELRDQLVGYKLSHRGIIYSIAHGSDAKILVAEDQSERHPDLLIYKTPPPDTDVWSTWIPEIVIEVVSPSSAHRDYEEKPQEYLAFGVSEYWILDAAKQQMTVLRRSRGQWAPKIVKHGETYSTRLLPEFTLDLAAVLDAAKR